jgi:hypothetical protein
MTCSNNVCPVDERLSIDGCETCHERCRDARDEKMRKLMETSMYKRLTKKQQTALEFVSTSHQSVGKVSAVWVDASTHIHTHTH